ncbi:MAG TPA: thiamine pyrophosphate-binding protein, partial [Acidimicrobiia bacterium]|nr:thiamine pyrophosphate-binding protein [Acidimicrobiia bacterium]
MAKMNGAQALLATLELLGVDTVFGVPGGAILPVYDALVGSPLRHVAARHEQGAGHMAEGYAMATGRPGVVFSTSGPGATNLVTPLMNALADSTPLVAVTGQVATGVIGTNAVQEAPTIELTRGCTKANWLVEEVEDLVGTVVEAFTVATHGRPGPVLIDLPKDVQSASLDWNPPRTSPAFDPPSGMDPTIVRQAREMLDRSRRPVLYVGGGIIGSGASSALRRLAEAVNVPVVTTLMGRGAFPDDHPLALGMPGMHGVYAATTALQQADLLLAVGVRFDDRVTGNPAAFAPRAEVIHVDIDERE